jgi:uncharacterized protein (UPF0276 family)
VHAIGLSIGGEAPLDKEHLARIKRLCDWLDPAFFRTFGMVNACRQFSKRPFAAALYRENLKTRHSTCGSCSNHIGAADVA